MRRVVAAVVVLGALAGRASAEAEEVQGKEVQGKYTGVDAPPPGGWRLMLSDLTILRLNPIGLETRGRFGLQKRLYASEKKISKNNFAFVGAYPKLNPANASFGVGGELQPVSMFNLRAMAEVQQYFGTFGFLQSFTSPTKNYSDAQIDALETVPGRAPQATNLFHIGIAPTLQAKVGPIAVRTLVQLDYWDLNIRAGDTVAYEPTYDTLLPDGGWTLSTDTDVLYTGRPGLAIGLRHSFVHAFYGDKHFADRDLSADENKQQAAAFGDRNSHQRLGLFAAYTMRDRGPSKFNKPTVVLILSWYLDHRWRLGAPAQLRPGETAGDFTNRAVPYFLLGYAFESDFLPVR
ncbi:MAG: hypothetical protein KIT31_08615 [Deltaproteobacteria bacterium]|nr:hypothetical protein [Deltaproteobacteria bacterium]